MKYMIRVVLVMGLLVSGCDGTSPQPMTLSGPSKDYLETNSAKILFYASYSDEKDKPYFKETFRLHIDGGYIEDIEADQYTEMRLAPGKHEVTVDHISWAGSVLNQARLTLTIGSGKSAYIREEVIPDEKPVLSQVDDNQGNKDIAARTRLCLCSSPLSKLFE